MKLIKKWSGIPDHTQNPVKNHPPWTRREGRGWDALSICLDAKADERKCEGSPEGTVILKTMQEYW